MKVGERSATPPSQATALLHGRTRLSLARACVPARRACTAFVFTCALTAVVSAMALAGATAFGAMPIGLALLVSTVVVYTITGLRPLTVALAGATALTISIGGSDATRIDVERALDAFARTISVIIG